MENIKQLQINVTKTEWLALKQIRDTNGKQSWRQWLNSFIQ